MSLPDSIGGYEVVGRLAVGGMAEIFLGRQRGPHGFVRPVVIKRILPHLSHESAFVDMFLDEARIVAGIRHPNVVQIHEFGSESGELFLVMEYLEGENVGGILRRLWSHDRAMDPALAIHILAEACSGLHAAHELCDESGRPRQIVHRDVTPQNIFVTYDAAVKLLDFGIAKAEDRHARTETGQVKGKFAYMSPEQCLGEPVDRRSDIFSLGTLLYELTTSRLLFYRESTPLTVLAVCQEEIIPPSEVNASYPKRLEAICLKALSREPADRYPTAAAMRRDLLACLRELAGDTPPDEALKALMHEHFGDRIAEKTQLLGRVRETRVLSLLPEPEADPHVALPPMSSERPHRQRRSRRSLKRAGTLLFAGTAAGALAVLALLGSRRNEEPQESRSVPLPASQAQSSADPQATQVMLHVETVPEGAHVAIDDRIVGQSPVDIPVARSTAPVALKLTHEGYQPLTRLVIPDSNRELLLTLRPHARTAPASSTSAPPPTPSASAKSFRRFD